jgi:hypothetical protein
MDTTGESSLFELALDQESIAHLGETARWGKFLAIAGFVTCGLIAVIGVIAAAVMSTSGFGAFSTLPREGADLRGFGAIFGVMIAGIYLVVGAIYFFPCLFLYNYSVRMKRALKLNDQANLNRSLKAQKYLFRYVGIMTIIGMACLAIEIVIFLVIGTIALTTGGIKS